jgi:hypothetical protein
MNIFNLSDFGTNEVKQKKLKNNKNSFIKYKYYDNIDDRCCKKGISDMEDSSFFAAKNFKRREIMVKRRLLAASLATIVCLGGE